MLREIRLALIGFGRVGRAFSELVQRDADRLEAGYRFRPSIVGIVRSGPRAWSAMRSDLAWQEMDASECLVAWTPDIVVQAIPSSKELSADAVAQIRDALSVGAHVVTATKSGLVYHWQDVSQLARAAGRAVRISAALGAGMPLADTVRHGMTGLTCHQLRASLNGTSNFMLEAMRGGSTWSEALATAQAAGMAESDPTADISGLDSAMKLVMLTNLLWDLNLQLDDVVRQPIEPSAADDILRASKSGRVLRAVAHANPRAGDFAVRLESVDESDSLFYLPGAQKAAVFDTEEAGIIFVGGGASSPVAAAGALMRDILNIALGDQRPGLS